MSIRTLRSAEFYTALPKVDLHRHLEGSIRLRTLMEIGRSYGFLMVDTAELRPLVQVGEDQPNTFGNFLSKFTTLRSFYCSPEVITRITQEAIEDAAADNVRYLELRFTPVALSRSQNFPLNEVMDWVIEGVQRSQQELGVKVGLIASVNRHENMALAEKVVDLAIERKGKGIVGLGLAGNEAAAKATPFIGLFNDARQSGMQITIHAGEWSGPENVFEAISKFKSGRVGHGVRTMEDPKVVDLARERGTTFEVCITSNYHSGVVPALTNHPFARMLSAGLNATLSSDNPRISQIVLSDEVRLASEALGIPLSVFRDQTLTAARAAFMSEDERDGLVQSLEKEFQQVLSNC
ncbi:MAG: adenosine deaminase [Anaerolineales bacterium]|jgi:adenosine deaminase